MEEKDILLIDGEMDNIGVDRELIDYYIEDLQMVAKAQLKKVLKYLDDKMGYDDIEPNTGYRWIIYGVWQELLKIAGVNEDRNSNG